MSAKSVALFKRAMPHITATLEKFSLTLFKFISHNSSRRIRRDLFYLWRISLIFLYFSTVLLRAFLSSELTWYNANDVRVAPVSLSRNIEWCDAATKNAKICIV